MAMFRVSGALALLLAVSAASFAQSTARLGGEFQVNVYTIALQGDAAIAADADGDFVVTWRSYAQDGESNGIFARRFDSAGLPLGAEFQVNLVTVGAQIAPAVDRDADGDFVVVWQSSDGNGNGIFGRRFNSAGTAQGAAFLINAHTNDSQYRPAVALDADGDFVVAWTSYSQDGEYGGVFARLFTASGSPGAEFRVNVYTVDAQVNQAVARDQDGDFVVVWESYNQDRSMSGVFGRRFNALGTALGVEFQVNSSTINPQGHPRIDLESDGDFVVAWAGLGDNGYETFFQRFSSSGTRLGLETQANTYVSQSQSDPAVALSGSGSFVVTWDSGLQDGDQGGIFLRHFDAFGTPLGKELQVNTYTTGQEVSPQIAMDAGGRFVIVWGSPRDGGGGSGIFGQRFRTLANLDVDGDGTFLPLTDGVLVLRYAFGFRGATLITGAVGPGCTRCTAPEIEAHIGSQL